MMLRLNKGHKNLVKNARTVSSPNQLWAILDPPAALGSLWNEPLNSNRIVRSAQFEWGFARFPSLLPCHFLLSFISSPPLTPSPLPSSLPPSLPKLEEVQQLRPQTIIHAYSFLLIISTCIHILRSADAIILISALFTFFFTLSLVMKSLHSLVICVCIVPYLPPV